MTKRPAAPRPSAPTEATVTERVPARLAIRAAAPFELPHIMLFADDPAHTLLEPLFAACKDLPPLYDFELMQGGGHITGRLAAPGAQTDAFFRRLDAYAQAVADRAPDGAPLLFATGDGKPLYGPPPRRTGSASNLRSPRRRAQAHPGALGARRAGQSA